MNKYIFLRTERKYQPSVEHVILADDVFAALEQADHYPYDLINDWESGCTDLGQKKRAVYEYYGINSPEGPNQHGNGSDGYGHMIIVVPEQGDITTYPPQA